MADKWLNVKIAFFRFLWRVFGKVYRWSGKEMIKYFKELHKQDYEKYERGKHDNISV
jgi:hypothetical protein